MRWGGIVARLLSAAIVLSGCSGNAAPDRAEPPEPSPFSTPELAPVPGDPLPDELLGQYEEGGNQGIVWGFYPAVHLFCMSELELDGGCVTVRGEGTPEAEFAAAFAAGVDGDVLLLEPVRGGEECTGEVDRFRYALDGDRLSLEPDGSPCIQRRDARVLASGFLIRVA